MKRVLFMAGLIALLACDYPPPLPFPNLGPALAIAGPATIF